MSLVLMGAAASGVVGKLAEKFTDYLTDLVRGQDQAVQQKATENAAAFLGELSKQISRIEQRGTPFSDSQIEQALRDPDVAITIRTALAGAARTSSQEKHDALARAVAERLGAAAESNEALASVIAADAIPKLSVVHLRFLGIAAVVFTVRPLSSLYSGLPANGHLDAEQIRERYDSYTSWLKTSLERLHTGVTLDELQIAHLVSAGCLTYERKLLRDLTAVLTPKRSAFLDPRATWHVGIDIGEFLNFDPTGRDLGSLWEYGLQHVTLTPAGRLIGAAVHESVGGDAVDLNWARAESPQDQAIDDAVWDGRTIREEFLRALDRAVRDRAERRVRPWISLAKE